MLADFDHLGSYNAIECHSVGIGRVESDLDFIRPREGWGNRNLNPFRLVMKFRAPIIATTFLIPPSWLRIVIATSRSLIGLLSFVVSTYHELLEV